MKQAIIILLTLPSFYFCYLNKVEVETKETTQKNELTENQAYKMLYDNQVKANDAVLKTIFYALGGLGTAVLLVFGSNWYFNHQKVKDAMNEIDTKIASVKKDALAEISEKINSLSTEINQNSIKLQEEIATTFSENTTKFSDFTEKTRQEIKEENKSSQINFQDLLKSYNENLSQQIGFLKDSLDEKIKNVTSQIDLNENKYEYKLSFQSKTLKRDILKQNAEITFLKGNFNIALKAYLDLALYDYEIGYSQLFEHTALDIVKCLDRVTYIYDDEEECLKKLIELSSIDYPDETKKITDLFIPKEIKFLTKK